MNILLVEPAYKTTLEPLGLMRISSMHKAKGDIVKFVKGRKKLLFTPDKIYITTLFTYNYNETIKAVRFYRNRYKHAEILVGGILATINPELFEKEGVTVHKGILNEAESYPPDYSLFPKIDKSITFASRGCIRKCSFCCVWRHDGKFVAREWIQDIDLRFKKIMFLDNNWLAKDNKDLLRDIELLRELKKKGITLIDFNQSLDAILFTSEIAQLLKGLPIYPMRFSFDHMGQDKHCQNAIKLSIAYGFKEVRVDVLYNWNDTPEDFYYRLKEIISVGGCAVPMRYTPLESLDKEYVGKHWTKRERDGVARINPYTHGQISSGSIEEFEHYFGKDEKEFKRLLNFKNLRLLKKLRAEKSKRDGFQKYLKNVINN